MLGQSVKGGHQRVPLLPALALRHLVGVTIVIYPGVAAWTGIELPGEGEERL